MEQESILYFFAALFAAALVVSLALTPLARALALRIGLVDKPGARKIHEKVMPYGGGIAIFLTTALLLPGTYLCLSSSLLPADVIAALKPYILSDMEDGTLRHLAAILIGGGLIFLLGLCDDKRGLSPKVKLAVQFAVAIGVVASGVRATFFIDNFYLTGAATVIWIVAVTNAFNLLDNMDGLSAGVAAIAALLFFIIAVQGEQFSTAAFLAVFAGALLGFLKYNFSPARLFMGDAGSLLAGFILASLTVAGTYYEGRGSLYAVCMPILVLGVPLFDTASVMWIRWRNGKPFFQGDTNHFSHRLVRLGMTRREAVLTVYLLGLILGGAATLLGQLTPAGAAVVLLIGLGIIALIVMLENAAARKELEEQKSGGE